MKFTTKKKDQEVPINDKFVKIYIKKNNKKTNGEVFFFSPMWMALGYDKWERGVTGLVYLLKRPKRNLYRAY